MWKSHNSVLPLPYTLVVNDIIRVLVTLSLSFITQKYPFPFLSISKITLMKASCIQASCPDSYYTHRAYYLVERLQPKGGIRIILIMSNAVQKYSLSVTTTLTQQQASYFTYKSVHYISVSETTHKLKQGRLL